MRVRLETIGCRLNIGEIEAMARLLASSGHRVSGPGEPADLCILNTCAVTAIASRKSRQLIRQFKRRYPDAALVVTGCDVELSAGQMAAIGVDFVVKNADKDRLIDLVAAEGLLHDPEPDGQPTELFTPGENGHTRAFLKVQDGCDNRCTFCVIMIARGAGRSVQPAKVLHEIAGLQAAGFREIVLSGVHLGSYGHDLGDRRGLKNLVERILSETDLERLRLSSLEPWDLDPDFFAVFSDDRLLPHLHLPLQSGCDRTLLRMARRTSQLEYAQLLESARAAVPGIAISTDVMCGFPGESDAEFEESIAFVNSMGFSRLHVFRFSPRAQTRAATMPHQVPGPRSAERSRRLHLLAADLENRFNSGFVGSIANVLWESAEDLGDVLRWSGLTPNYIRVSAATPPDFDLLNTITPTAIVDVVPGGVIGRAEL